ncbi:hypothetical protein CK203_094023 [Vitis vinifera]|uniref:Uncharacterized protein n=1 Tax=Vitis vinifera TaxID=29760 RepID=A0A438BS10_VITVI|nr:hypothetical protein CK203_094023 [Vitis vinifera]
MDCCCCGGVTWDTTGHVASLDHSSQLIYGGFSSSSSIFSLQHLQSLNLANTFYFSQIPSGFHELGNVTYLINYFNYRIGIPTLKLESPNLRMLIQNLKDLRELHLNGLDILAQRKEWCQALSSSVPDLQVLSMS